MLAEARRLIASGGIEALTLRRLAAGSGMAVNTVYALLGRSRETILEAIVDDGLRDLDLRIHESEVHDVSDLSQTLGALVDYVIERPEIYQPVFLAEDHTKASGANRWGDERALHIGGDILIAAVEEGLIDDKHDTDLLTQHMLSVFREGARRWAAGETGGDEFRAGFLYAVQLALLATSTDRSREGFRVQLVDLERTLNQLAGRRGRRAPSLARTRG